MLSYLRMRAPTRVAPTATRLELLHLRAVDLSLSIYSLFGKSFALFPVLFRGIRGSSGLVEARRGDLIPFCGFAGAI
ncbi:hypothetical protein AAC387_Pa01g2863 [Persea americana]